MEIKQIAFRSLCRLQVEMEEMELEGWKLFKYWVGPVMGSTELYDRAIMVRE